MSKPIRVTLDLETKRADHVLDPADRDALIPHRAQITVVGLQTSHGDELVFRDLFDLEDYLLELDADYDIVFEGHEFKFDIKMLHFNSPLDGNWLTDRWVDDSKLMAYVMPEKIPDRWLVEYERKRQEANKQLPHGFSHRQAGLHSLKTLAPYHLKVAPFWETPDDHDNDDYVLKDVRYTAQLRAHLQTIMHPDDYDFYKNKQMVWAKELLRAELRGIKLDEDLLARKEAEAIHMLTVSEERVKDQWQEQFRAWRERAIDQERQRIQEMEGRAVARYKQPSAAQIVACAQRHAEKFEVNIKKMDERGDLELNLNSTEQLKWLLSEQLGYDLRGFSGKESTEKEVLENLATKHGDVRALLDYRKYQKLCSTYYPSYRRFLHNGRIHCSFNTDVTRTGRLSCIEGSQYVSTTRGDIPIKDVVPGDMVYTFNRKNNVSVRRVRARKFGGLKECVRIRYVTNSPNFKDSLICTPDHHIKTVKRGWVQAQELNIGDVVYGFSNPDETAFNSGHYDAIRVVSVDPIKGEKFGVYDLTIEDHENFIVNNVCVHNSSFPNLQNQPADVRELFVSDGDGRVLITKDLSQIEPRLVAYFSEDETLCRSFIKGEDFHAITAKVIFPYIKCAVSHVKKEFPVERQVSKPGGLAVMYGSGANRLKKILDENGMTGYSKAQCRTLVDRIRSFYKTVWRFKEGLDRRLSRKEVVYNLMGRPIKFSDPDEIYMKGFNRLIQGSASDLLLEAIYLTNKYAREKGIDAQVLLPVHDEIVMECHGDYVDEMEQVLEKNMMGAAGPLATKWGEIKLLVEGATDGHWRK